MCREAVALLAAGRTTRSSSCCRLDAAAISRVKCFLNCGIAGFAAHECDTNGRRNVPRFNNEYRLAIANSMVIFVVNVFWRCPNVWIDAVSERHLLESPNAQGSSAFGLVCSECVMASQSRVTFQQHFPTFVQVPCAGLVDRSLLAAIIRLCSRK